MNGIVSDVLFAVGCVLVIVGMWFVWWPLALLVAGAICIVLAYVFAVREKANKGQRP